MCKEMSFHRRWRSLWSCVLLLLFITLTACAPGGESIEEFPGYISLEIPGAGSRDLSGSDTSFAAVHSNSYEVFIYNDVTGISAIVDPAAGAAVLSVAPGTYTVLVAAGAVSGSQGVLLGSGKAETVTVEAGLVSDVSISLHAITHSFSVPSSVTCSQEYTVNVSGDTNNSLLQVSTGGTTMDNQPYVELAGDSTNRYLSCTVTGSAWSGAITFTAPVQPETTSITLHGSNISLVDPQWSRDSDLGDLLSVNWMWPNSAYIPAELSEETEKAISFAQSAEGMSIGLEWQNL